MKKLKIGFLRVFTLILCFTMLSQGVVLAEDVPSPTSMFRINQSQEDLSFTSVPNPVQLTASAAGSNDVIPSGVKWSSNDDSVGKVDENGLLTFTGYKGFVTITAKYDGNSAKVTASMDMPRTLLKLDFEKQLIYSGTSVQLSVRGTYSDNSPPSIITSGLSWSSSNPSVANVNDTGLVTFTGQNGSVTITASSGNLQVNTTALVNNPVSELSIVVPGETFAYSPTPVLLQAKNGDTPVNNEAVWSSSNASIASVSNGTVTFTGKTGTVTIYASYGGKSASVSTTVTKSLTSIEIPEKISFSQTPIQLSLVGIYSDTSRQSIPTSSATWSSDNPSVAKVDNGKVTFTGNNGKVTITATYANKTATVFTDVTNGTALSEISINGTLSFSTTPVTLTLTGKLANNSTIAVANAIFYGAAQVAGASGLAWLLLFMLMCVITFTCVHVMRKPGWRWVFWLGIGLNVFNLVFYKYTFFILSSIENLTGIQFGFTEAMKNISMILPLGISFYTFEFISYLIDVRRGRSVPTKSFLSFWVFVSTFPHLIAGPIMRGDELLPQIKELNNKRIPWSEIKYGLYLIIIGLIKKVVIADNISPIADAIFKKFQLGIDITGTESWIGSYLFTFQIYYDFSAYTDMAIGCGILLGLRFANNFRTPYLSKSPKEFWDRWHITLSRWIRDYIYIGLGGNRKGAVRTYINLFAAMVISGLWHGANWTFILWGAIWGALLVIHRLSLKLNRWSLVNQVRESLIYRLFALVIFFHVTVWTWVFFRAESLEQAFTMTWKMMHALPSNIVQAPEFALIVLLFLLHICENVLRNYENTISRIWHKIPFPFRSVCYLGIVFLLIYFLKGEKYEFIYFQF